MGIEISVTLHIKTKFFFQNGARLSAIAQKWNVLPQSLLICWWIKLDVEYSRSNRGEDRYNVKP